MNLTCGFLVLIISIFVITSFNMNIFAEEVTIQTPLSLGSNHQGRMLTTQTSSFDGSTLVFLTFTEPVKGEHMTISSVFTDKNGKAVQDINYDIIATQNGQVILSKTMINQHIGSPAHLTQVLPSDDRVNITITIQGMETHPIIVSQGEPSDSVAIPEFGTIAMMILVVSIISIIVISTKHKMPLTLLK